MEGEEGGELSLFGQIVLQVFLGTRVCFSLSLTGESWHQAPMCNKVMRGGEAGPGPAALGGKLLRGEAQAGSGWAWLSATPG